MISQSSPLLSSRTPLFQPQQNIKEEEEEEEEDTFLDATESPTVEPTSSSDIIRPSSSASTNSSLKSFDSTTGKPFGRKSIIVSIHSHFYCMNGYLYLYSWKIW